MSLPLPIFPLHTFSSNVSTPRIIHVNRRNINQQYVSSNNHRKTRLFSSATQVKPCRAGLRTGWITHREYCREGPFFVLSFLFLLSCLLCEVIFKSVLKIILSIVSAAGFGKKTNTAVQFTRNLLYFGPWYRTETLICRRGI